MEKAVKLAQLKLKKQVKQLLFFLSFVFLPITLIITLIVGLVNVDRIWFVQDQVELRISTFIAALVCYCTVLFLYRERFSKSIYLAILSIIFPMALYETIWYFSAAALNGWDFRPFEFIALFGWILLGLKEVYHIKPSKITKFLYLIFIITFLIWLLTGFSFNSPSNPQISLLDEVLNATSKTSLFAAYLLHLISPKLNKKS